MKLLSLRFFTLTIAVLISSTTTFAQDVGFESGNDGQAVHIDPLRSLIVTELSILKRFPLARTMNQLAMQTAVPGMTGEKLFRQWFDILNPRNEARTSGPHCDDITDPVTGVGLINTFPFSCRPASKGAEGSEALLATNPLNEYIPVALTSRFDLAPADGAHCGEYRIVYARRSGATDIFNRNFLIFEAALPNPRPALGLIGCKQIVKFWADLSKIESVEKRAKALEDFYYQGMRGCMPVVHISHYGGNAIGAGQLRTNMFMQPIDRNLPPIWSLREFKLFFMLGVHAEIRPVTLKTNPFGPLFNSNGTHPLTREFQDYFITQVKDLATNDFSFNYEVPDRFNAAQGQANDTDESNYVAQLGGDTSPFGQRIQAELERIGSTLTPTEIVARAQSLSCAGCHQLNSDPAFSDAERSLGGGLIFPRSFGFTATIEQLKEVRNGEEAWMISELLEKLLLPDRKRILEEYLADRLKRPSRPAAPIGGKPHH